MKDESLIHILLAKEPWNAGHGWVMKAWQNLKGIVLDMVVDGDKIFQGVSEATLKKRYQLYLDLGKKWDQEKRRKETNWRMKKTEMIFDQINSSIVSVEVLKNLWEEFIMCIKEN